MRINQEDLAKVLNVNRSAISKYESGTIPLTDDSIKTLCDYFGVTSDYLLGRTNDSALHANLKSLKIPILDRIPTGIPLEAIDDVIDYEEIPAEWTVGDKEYFALKVRGDSMAPKYLNGDTVVFLKSPDYESGEDCAVVINGEDASFKKVRKNADGIILHPLNAAYEPKFYSNKDIEDLSIIVVGIAKEIRRKT